MHYLADVNGFYLGWVIIMLVVVYHNLRAWRAGSRRRSLNAAIAAAAALLALGGLVLAFGAA